MQKKKRRAQSKLCNDIWNGDFSLCLIIWTLNFHLFPTHWKKQIVIIIKMLCVCDPVYKEKENTTAIPLFIFISI